VQAAPRVLVHLPKVESALATLDRPGATCQGDEAAALRALVRSTYGALCRFYASPHLEVSERATSAAEVLVLVLGVIVPLVVVARHNRLFFGGGGASLPKRSH
jgi:hypothetical protein